MLPPGAVTSGLMLRSVVGPQLEKSLIWYAVAGAVVRPSTFVMRLSVAASSFSPAAFVIMTAVVSSLSMANDVSSSSRSS